MEVLQLELGQFAWLLHRQPTEPIPDLNRSVGTSGDNDLSFVDRVMVAYRLSFSRYRRSGSGWDHELFALKKEIHDALLGDDVAEAARLLSNPAQTTSFWGFDAVTKAPPGETE